MANLKEFKEALNIQILTELEKKRRYFKIWYQKNKEYKIKKNKRMATE